MLPALPEQWADGSISNVKAKGNISITMKWENGKIIELQMEAKEPKRVELFYQGKEISIKLKAGINKVTV